MGLIAGSYPAIEALEAALLPEKGLRLGKACSISMEDVGWERVGLFGNIKKETTCHILLVCNHPPVLLKTIDHLLPCSTSNKALEVLGTQKDRDPFKLL